jgi:hypothetical protein
MESRAGSRDGQPAPQIVDRVLPVSGAWEALSLSTLEPALPGAETLSLDAAFDEMLRATAAHPLRATLPLVVLSPGLPLTLPVFTFRAGEMRIEKRRRR